MVVGPPQNRKAATLAPMLIGLVAGAKGLAVGVLTLCFTIAGAFVYETYWGPSPCLGNGMDNECDTAVRDLGISLVVLFSIMLALGPLLAWGFLLPLPGGYVIPPLVTMFIVPLVYAGLPREFLLVAPLAAYPVVAVLTAGRRRKIRAPSPGSQVSSP